VLINRASRRALAGLPDRETKTAALWLQAHPGVGVLARERFRADADGARQGTPEALQGAERLHLLQYLADALDQVLNTHRHTLSAVNTALRGAHTLPGQTQGAASQPHQTILRPSSPSRRPVASACGASSLRRTTTRRGPSVTMTAGSGY
jgi:transposase